jgi:hypothetical protein
MHAVDEAEGRQHMFWTSRQENFGGVNQVELSRQLAYVDKIITRTYTFV